VNDIKIMVNHGSVVGVVHHWDTALIDGTMDSNSYINPCIFSEELLQEIKRNSLYAILTPVFWTGMFWSKEDLVN